MKLVAKRGTEDSDKIVRGDWESGDSEINWLSVWWEPTDEDYFRVAGKKTRAYHGGEHGIPELALSFIPEHSRVYACFSSIMDEKPDMVQKLQERGFEYEMPAAAAKDSKSRETKEAGRGWWRSIRNAWPRPSRIKDDTVYAEVDRDFVAFAFQTFASWKIDVWNFLVCQELIADWTEHLHRLIEKRMITKNLLRKIDLYLSSRWEHGFELLSSKLSHEQLEARAQDACTKLNWQFETRTI